MNKAERDKLSIRRDALLAKKRVLDAIELFREKGAEGGTVFQTSYGHLSRTAKIQQLSHFENVLNGLQAAGAASFKKDTYGAISWGQYSLTITLGEAFDEVTERIRREYHEANDELQATSAPASTGHVISQKGSSNIAVIGDGNEMPDSRTSWKQPIIIVTISVAILATVTAFATSDYWAPKLFGHEGRNATQESLDVTSDTNKKLLDKRMNNADYLSLDKNTALLLPTFDTSSIVGSDISNIVLSLYVASYTGEERQAQITINQIDLNTGRIETGTSDFITPVEGRYTDFKLPRELFESMIGTSKRLLVKLVDSNASLLLKGPDEFGTSNDPKLVVEHSDPDNADVPPNVIVKNEYVNLVVNGDVYLNDGHVIKQEGDENEVQISN